MAPVFTCRSQPKSIWELICLRAWRAPKKASKLKIDMRKVDYLEVNVAVAGSCLKCATNPPPQFGWRVSKMEVIIIITRAQ